MSTTGTAQPKVLISGAGPTGLIIALALVKNGIPVRIIEKDAAFHNGQRGSGIQPRTLELFALLGILPDILRLAQPGKVRCIYEMPGGVQISQFHDMMPYIAPTSDVPYSNPMSLGQTYLEEILRKHLSRYDTHVELNTELVDFEQGEGGVEARIIKRGGAHEVSEALDVEYLVGAEGAKSLVRSKLGLTFLGVTRPADHMVVGDIKIKNLNEEYWHCWGDAATKALFLRGTEDSQLFSFMALGKEADLDAIMTGRDGVIRYIVETTHRKDLEFGELDWLSDFRPNIRMVNKFREGRVFVVGDSAHVHSPTGGQGMNSGAQDAINLGWKIALVSKGLSPPSLLETYTEERLPVIKAMLERTTAILEKTLAYRADGSNNSGWDRPKDLLQLGVNCRWSHIVIDEQHDCKEAAAAGVYLDGDSTVLYAGDRAPDASRLQVVPGSGDEVTGKITSFFEIFDPAFHTALIFAADTKCESVKGILAALGAAPVGTIKKVIVYPGAPGKIDRPAEADLAVRDVDGQALNGYPPVPKGFKVIIVRPDGTVGAVVNGAVGIRQYLLRVFTV